jgi:hypothetical protein
MVGADKELLGNLMEIARIEERLSEASLEAIFMSDTLMDLLGIY